MAMDREDRLKALDAAISQIEKQYGKGTVMKLGDPSSTMNIETTPTGSLALDIALGLGGIPKGRVIEVYGPESSGKTTLTLHMIAEVQRRGGIAGHHGRIERVDRRLDEQIGDREDHVLDARRDAEAQDPPDLVAVEPQFAEAELAGVVQAHHVPHDEDG